MQTTKFLVVIGTVAVLAASDSAFAGPDNEAQAKMREAMRLRMEELSAPTTPVAPAAPAPAPVPVPVAPPKVVEKPVARPATVVVPVTTQSHDDQNTARLIEEMRRQQEAAKKSTAPAPTPASAPVAAAPKQNNGFSDVSDLENDAKSARLREALRQQLAAEQAAPAPTPVVAAPVKPVATPAPGTPASPVKPVATVKPAPAVAAVAPTTQPLVANIPTAASPLTGSKQDRLAELLRRYKTDAITPQEYHTQRAAIIAE